MASADRPIAPGCRPQEVCILEASQVHGAIACLCPTSQGQQLATPPITAKATVAYRQVNGHEILADVWRPATDQVCPVIVWIHGGALIMGHREGIHPKVRELAEEKGYALVSIDYRLAPETKLPDLISDIEEAFRWLQGPGTKQFHFDPSRIVVLGGSAGGYLTLVTGYRVEPKPKALVALYGYGSLVADWYSKPSAHPRHNPREIRREESAQIEDAYATMREFVITHLDSEF